MIEKQEEFKRFLIWFRDCAVTEQVQIIKLLITETKNKGIDLTKKFGLTVKKLKRMRMTEKDIINLLNRFLG